MRKFSNSEDQKLHDLFFNSGFEGRKNGVKRDAHKGMGEGFILDCWLEGWDAANQMLEAVLA